MSIYLVTVIYQHTDGRTVEAVAVAQAKEADGAVRAAVDAVAEYPHCERVLGGMCEELGPDTLADDAVAAVTAVAAGGRPEGSTVH